MILCALSLQIVGRCIGCPEQTRSPSSVQEVVLCFHSNALSYMTVMVNVVLHTDCTHWDQLSHTGSYRTLACQEQLRLQLWIWYKMRGKCCVTGQSLGMCECKLINPTQFLQMAHILMKLCMCAVQSRYPLSDSCVSYILLLIHNATSPPLKGFCELWTSLSALKSDWNPSHCSGLLKLPKHSSS